MSLCVSDEERVVDHLLLLIYDQFFIHISVCNMNILISLAVFFSEMDLLM